jgi:hypothetical protein
MSAHANPDIIDDGLVFMYNTDDGKSFKGQPATNLIASGLPGYFGSGGETLYQKSLYGLESDSGVFQRNYVTNPATSDSATFNNNGGLYKNFSTSTLNANTEYIQVSFDFYLITPYVKFGASGVGLNGYMQIRSTDNTTNNYGWDTRYSNGSGDDWNNSSNYVGSWQRVSLIIDITADKTPQDINVMYIYCDRLTQGEGIFTNFIITEHTTLPTSPIRYTSGTRSATQGLIDRTGNTTIDISDASFNSNAQMTFDGTDDHVSLGNPTALRDLTAGTIETVYYRDASSGTYQMIFTDAGSDLEINYSANVLQFYIGNSGLSYTHAVTDQWFNVVGTWGASFKKLYINGVQVASGGNTGTDTGSRDRFVGGRGANFPFNGEIPIAKVYNRTLTAAEVLQNFNATKSRFGL